MYLRYLITHHSYYLSTNARLSFFYFLFINKIPLQFQQNALCILHNAMLYITEYGLPKKPCSMSAPEPCRGQHSMSNNSDAE